MPLKDHAAYLAYQDNYRRTHLKEVAAYAVKYRKMRPRRKTECEYKRKFGITLADYDALCVKQNGLCAVCGRIPRGNAEKSRRLHVDHDHSTGKIDRKS